MIIITFILSYKINRKREIYEVMIVRSFSFNLKYIFSNTGEIYAGVFMSRSLRFEK